MSSLLADPRVVAHRQAEHEVVNVRLLRRRHDFVVRRWTTQPIADIFCDGAVEERRLLRHDRHLLAKAVHVDVVDADAVDQLKNDLALQVFESAKYNCPQAYNSPAARIV